METIPFPEASFPEQKTVRSVASRCAFAVIVYFLFANLMGLPVLTVLSAAFWRSDASAWSQNLETVLSGVIGLVALVATWAIMFRTVPKTEAPSAPVPLSFRRYAFYLPCAVAMVYTGAMIGEIPGLFGASLSNAEATMFDGVSLWAQILGAVILGPIAEELLFRKFMLDRLSGFRPTTAIQFTALLFGLAHGNLRQFLHAFLVGFLLGIVYYRTQNVLYPILLHASTNALGVLSDVIENVANGWAVHGIYLTLSLIGLFILIRYRKQFLPIPSDHPRYTKAFFVNAGWILCCVLFGATIILREIANFCK